MPESDRQGPCRSKTSLMDIWDQSARERVGGREGREGYPLDGFMVSDYSFGRKKMTPVGVTPGKEDAMKLDRLAPWNWFKKEEELEGRSVPVKRRDRAEGMSHPVVRLQSEIDRLFDDFFRGFPDPARMLDRFLPGVSAEFFRPTMDIAATDTEYTLTVELPGVDEKDVSIELDGDTLKIRGEKKQEKEEKEKDYHRIERSYGAFQRILSLPEDARSDGISAKFAKGVLSVTIPRAKGEKTEPRRIPIAS